MSNSISFPYYPAANRTYGVFADVDGSRANTALFRQRALLIGQRLAGTADDDMPVLVTGLAQAGSLWGVGSMLYESIAQYLKADSFGELWAGSVAAPAGTAATGSLTVTVAQLGAGLATVYIGGVAFPVPVLAGDTAAQIATRIAAVVNADPHSPVAAAAVATAVNLTARHVGLLGNDIDIRLNYLGALGGEFPVPGLTLAIVPMSGGTGTPSLTALLANTGDITFDFVGLPFSDTASLQAMDAYFNFATGRWSWQSMLYGGYFTAARGTPGQLAAFGSARNGPNGSCLGVFDTPDPLWLVAADYCAVCAVSLRVDPNRPLQNLVMNFQAPPRTSSFVRSLRNTMLYDGISTYTVNRAGQVILERAVTFYQTNPAGQADNAFLDVETLYGTAALIRSWQQEMLRLFPRAKLLGDDNPIPGGSSATSALQIRIATIAWYRDQCAQGNAQNPNDFAREIIAQNAGNGLVKELLPVILPNQLRQIAAKVAFTKP